MLRREVGTGVITESIAKLITAIINTPESEHISNSEDIPSLNIKLRLHCAATIKKNLGVQAENMR